MWWLVLFLVDLSSGESVWVVQTEYGNVKGTFSAQTSVWEFRGIPYAGPPTGNNRYKAPIPPTPWDGVLEANRSNIMCPQRDRASGETVIGTEDCLIINVYVPESGKSGEPLPVLFYLHGGGLVYGDSNGHNPRLTTRHDIILVTINYRLGSLGYLCLGTEDAPGNAGLKDQIAGLHWVKRNINNFGGDPNAVTIYGVSSGASSAGALVLSRATNGLFHRAIIESGSAFVTSALSYKRLGVAKAGALQLNFEPVDNLTLLGEFYKEASVSNVLATNNLAYCIERAFVGSERVIHKSFKKVFEDRDYVSVPVMFVYGNLDGISFGGQFKNIVEYLEANFERYLPTDLYFESSSDRIATAKLVKSLYFNDKPITVASERGYVDYLTDTIFVNGIYRSAMYHAKNLNSVYLMEFAYRGGLNLPNNNFPNLIGAGHGDILAYVMGFTQNEFEGSKQDQLVRNSMTEMWTNFVKYGNPTPSHSNLSTEWKPFTKDEESYLFMGANMELRNHPLADRMKVWTEIYDKYYLPPPSFENNSATFNHKFSMLLLICLCGLFNM